MIPQISQQRILILGASSWLGYILLRDLERMTSTVGGTVYKSEAQFGNNIQIFRTSSSVSIKHILSTFQPTVLVNFLRGEDADGMSLHKEIIDFCKHNGAYYMYASSVLALDGYDIDTPLMETLEPKSISAYGIFKGECECLLLNSPIDWCVLRFASVQGWVPHKLTRNERFLQNIRNGKVIIVDKGVIQNRMYADLMIKGIIESISKKITGVIHFGTTDASEEIDFLKQQAELFGYSPNLVQKGKERQVNLVSIPNRIFDILGEKYRTSEQDTLDNIYHTEGLRQYLNS